MSDHRYTTHICQDADFCPEQVSEWESAGSFPDIQDALIAIGKALGSTGTGYVSDSDQLGLTVAVWQSGRVTLMERGRE